MFLPQKRNDRNYKTHHILYHQRLNVILFLTPKAGNTSIKQVLLRALGYDLNYEYPAGFEFLCPQDAWMLKTEHKAHAVAIMREPLRRLESCWKDKASVIPFDKFARVVAKIPDHSRQCNMHFRSQWATFTFEDQLIPDRVFIFEHIFGDRWDEFASYMTALGFPIEVHPPHLNRSHDREHKITPRTLEIIKKRYDKDFSLYERLCSSDERSPYKALAPD